MTDRRRDMGALPGSRASHQAPTGLAPSGFDPARKTYPWTFRFYGERRGAYVEACAALRRAGFSVGPRQRGAPTGVMFGDYCIAKWRNLTGPEREQLHGRIYADYDPVTVYFSAQPPEVDDAVFVLHQAIATDARRAGTARAEGIAQPGDRGNDG